MLLVLLPAVGIACRGEPQPVPPPELSLPARRADAPSGSAIVDRMRPLGFAARESLLAREVLAGNVPARLRRLVPITVGATIAGRERTLTYWVTADYLAVGDDDDFLRIPLRASTAQRLADRLGCMLPTRKMVDDIHHAAVVRLAPHPFHPDRYDITSVGIFDASNRAIESERAGREGLISGIKKDIVVSRLLDERPGRVAIYGWHRRGGRPIQPLSTAHTDAHVDYSHGVRLVYRQAVLDGEQRELPVLLGDPELWMLVSDNGPFGSWRYPVHRQLP